MTLAPSEVGDKAMSAIGQGRVNLEAMYQVLIPPQTAHARVRPHTLTNVINACVCVPATRLSGALNEAAAERADDLHHVDGALQRDLHHLHARVPTALHPPSSLVLVLVLIFVGLFSGLDGGLVEGGRALSRLTINS